MEKLHNIGSVIALTGLSPKEFALKVGVPYQMIIKYKNGNFVDIGHSKALAISKLSGIPIEQIDFTPEGNKRRV